MLIRQISDIHIKGEGVLAYGQADTLRFLDRCLDYLAVEMAPEELLVITGDMSDDGSPESYALLRDRLSRFKGRYFLLPGNHDYKPGLVRAFPEHAYLSDGVNEGGVDYLCYSLDEYPVRLIGWIHRFPGSMAEASAPGAWNGWRTSWGKKPSGPPSFLCTIPPLLRASGIWIPNRFQDARNFWKLSRKTRR